MRDSLLFPSVCCDYRPHVFPHSQCVYELPQLWVLSSQHSVCQTVGVLIDTAHAYWEKLLDSVGKAAVMSYRHSMWKRATLKEPNKTPPRERESPPQCVRWNALRMASDINLGPPQLWTHKHMCLHICTPAYIPQIYTYIQKLLQSYVMCVQDIYVHIFFLVYGYRFLLLCPGCRWTLEFS